MATDEQPTAEAAARSPAAGLLNFQEDHVKCGCGRDAERFENGEGAFWHCSACRISWWLADRAPTPHMPFLAWKTDPDGRVYTILAERWKPGLERMEAPWLS